MIDVSVREFISQYESRIAVLQIFIPALVYGTVILIWLFTTDQNISTLANFSEIANMFTVLWIASTFAFVYFRWCRQFETSIDSKHKVIDDSLLSEIKIRKIPDHLMVAGNECTPWLIVDNHLDGELFVDEMKERAKSRFEAICETTRESMDFVLFRQDIFQRMAKPNSSITYPLRINTRISPTHDFKGFEFELTFPEWIPSGAHLDQILGIFFENRVYTIEQSNLLRRGEIWLRSYPELKLCIKLEIDTGTLDLAHEFRVRFREIEAEVEDLTLFNRTKIATLVFKCGISCFEQHLQLVGISKLNESQVYLDFGWDSNTTTLRFWMVE